jgi:PAS domain-containing protein
VANISLVQCACCAAMAKKPGCVRSCSRCASDGRIKHFSIFSSDLTRTIEASREHENLIGALMRSTAVIEFDLNGNVLNANERFLQGMGYSLAQIKGKHHRMFCTPESTTAPSTRISGVA